VIFVFFVAFVVSGCRYRSKLTGSIRLARRAGK
jgi:hypothetical protein